MSTPAPKKLSHLDIGKIYNEALSLFKTCNFNAAATLLESVLVQFPGHQESLLLLLKTLLKTDQTLKAESYLSNLATDRAEPILLAVDIYKKNKSYDDAERVLRDKIDHKALKHIALSSLATVRTLQGYPQEGLQLLHKAHEADRSNPTILATIIADEHFNPELDLLQIRSLQNRWEKLYAPAISPSTQTRKIKNKALRLGILSDGFNNHPVARMTIGGLHALPKHEFQLYAYSSSNRDDSVKAEFKAGCDQWREIAHLSDDALSDRIKRDHIDILIDLSGYHIGSRLRMLASRPCPLLLKWVGGLNDSMGLSYIDYLITDRFESPLGSDHEYTEKLIRMPNGYISYTPPRYMPDVGPLPAVKNEFITFGCFNNANKLNSTINSVWARILNRVPNSRLLLKGSMYEGDNFKKEILKSFNDFGIGTEQIIFEGQADHIALLNSYNKVDITLDPWPFSGGLTTLESMMMGVPVVTYPGATFASRHSTSHVSNAGYSDLVADSWEEYIEIACALAQNIDVLQGLRAEIRGVFLAAPISNHAHFSLALRQALLAIWHRHCEEKPVAAVEVFDDHSHRFEDESESSLIDAKEKPEQNDGVNFNLSSPVLIVDHGARLIQDKKFTGLYNSNAVHLVCFDPAGLSKQRQLPLKRERLQVISDTLLGDGNPQEFYAHLDNSISGSLCDIDSDAPLVTLTLPSIRLNDLPSDQPIDWLMLSQQYQNTLLLENSGKALVDILVLSAIIEFSPNSTNSMSFDACRRIAERHGLEFYSFTYFNFNNTATTEALKKGYRGSQTKSAIAVFIPKNFGKLTPQRLEKLVFILHSYFDMPDIADHILQHTQHPQARNYADYLASHFAPPTVIPNRPAMSEPEIELLEAYLAKANNYYEFGSGGSTKLAASMGLSVHGAESDKQWLRQLKNDIGDLCQVQHIDIGSTGEWGYPIDLSESIKFPDYSHSIHTHNRKYDLILVDGRFRVACVLESILHAIHNNYQDQVRIFIHDFWNREHYSPVLRFLECIKSVDTAGVFKIKDKLDKNSLKKTKELFTDDYR